MFRHQIETFAILLEYGYTDAVLLKSALIHDLFEDGQKVGFSNFESVKKTDKDGKEVFDLVRELSIRVENGIEEPKVCYLERIMLDGSHKAKVLKLADRISNINSLPVTNNPEFIRRYIVETKQCVLPYADKIDKNMSLELNKSLMDYEQTANVKGRD